MPRGWNSGTRSPLRECQTYRPGSCAEAGFARGDHRPRSSRQGLDPSKLMLELTESVLIDEVAGQNLVDNVAPLGVGIAIDDFGTGYFVARISPAVPGKRGEDRPQLSCLG